MRYLVIEDDKTLLKILNDAFELLEAIDHTLFFDSGSAAWQWLNEIEKGNFTILPQIAFIDIRLPEYEGYIIAERIRAIPLLANMGIILMTAYELSDEEYQEAIARSQADLYISKPLPDFQDLLELVKHVAEKRQL